MHGGDQIMETTPEVAHDGGMSVLLETVTVATAIACGLVGGVFFAFSNFVMAALGQRPDREGIAAMQAINVTVLNPLFMLLLFGPVAASAGLAIAALGDLGEPHAPWLLAGALMYGPGCAGVSMALNVPLNEQLRGQQPDDAAAAAVWRRYRSRWTACNTLRTVAALAGAAALMAAVAAA
jgi:uncharacterized membrane protein